MKNIIIRVIKKIINTLYSILDVADDLFYHSLLKSGNIDKELRWKNPRLMYFNHDSYEEYIGKQREKLEKGLSKIRARHEKSTEMFFKNFKAIKYLSEEKKTCLCLGARLGSEVRALRKLGHLAVGIDINPGTENRYVLYGDFHSIDFPDIIFDAVYSNCFDHVFNLEKVLNEVDRVMKSDAIFILDINKGTNEGFEPGKYETMVWKKPDDLILYILNKTGWTILEKKEISFPWFGQQVIFAIK